MKNNCGFSLLEILITVVLLAVLAIGLILLLNPGQQIAKANDAKRKHDLAQLKKVLEDWYNDKGCYPLPNQICYDTASNVCDSAGGSCSNFISKVCHICGNASGSPPFTPYLSKLPCDPEHPKKDYFYEAQVSCISVSRPNSCCQNSSCTQTTCPRWYRIYATLSDASDVEISSLGCSGNGCGLAPNQSSSPYGYNYGVTSGNVDLERSDSFYCLNSQNRCNACGSSYQICQDPTKGCKIIYSSSIQCCQANPAGC